MNQTDLAVLVNRPELASIDPRSLLVEDLGLDSLALAEIVILLEDHSGRSVTPELIESLRTIADLLAWYDTASDG